MNAPMVAGEPAADRLMAAVARRNSWVSNPVAVAVVLHALADLEAIKTAHATIPYDPDLAVVRWLHAVADDLENGATR